MDVRSILKSPLLAGFVAIFIWSYVAVVIVRLGNLPPFEVLCSSMLIGGAATSLQLTLQHNWHLMRAPLEVWLSGPVLLAGMNITYLCAFKFAPPVHAELIYYLWPLFVAIGGWVFFNEKIAPRQILGIALCMFSMLVLHLKNFSKVDDINSKTNYGYGFALAGSVISAVYTLISKKHAAIPNQIVGLYAGLGSILSLIGHFVSEKTVMPSALEIMLLVLMGISAHWISYQAWDRAVKNLEAWKVCIVAYFTPSLSVTLLILFGFGEFSWNIVAACALLFSGSMLTNSQREDISDDVISVDVSTTRNVILADIDNPRYVPYKQVEEEQFNMLHEMPSIEEA